MSICLIRSIILATLLSSVVNKARPVRIGNLTFTWKAPPTDYGPIQFVASIVKGEIADNILDKAGNDDDNLDNKYVVIKTPEITFNGFPVSTRDCGRDISCFKECFTSPNCTSDESAYMVVINLSKNKKEVTISLGGIVENEQVNHNAERLKNVRFQLFISEIRSCGVWRRQGESEEHGYLRLLQGG